MPPASICGVCGTAAPAPFRPPPAETAPDLDLRPGEPTRSTLLGWVTTCRSCGACAPDLSTLPPELAEIVSSPAYRAVAPGPTQRFLRWAMLCASPSERAEATMQAAWAADDANDPAAASFRQEAARLWAGDPDPQTGLRRLDALRRAGAFAEAMELLDTLNGDPEILAFQRARISAQDHGRYLISSALRPPARTPHVGHGKRKTGFWKSLFGQGK
jgi:hypothetical protein